MSVVPPPMSMIMFPAGSVTGRPDPIAAAIDSSTRKTSLAFTRKPLSFTARRSTGRYLRRHANHEPRPHERALAVRLAHEVHQHLLSRIEVGDDAVLHRPHRLDVRRRPPEHLVGLDADRFDLPPGDVEGDDGRFVEDDAAAASKNAGVSGSEIDRHVGGESWTSGSWQYDLVRRKRSVSRAIHDSFPFYFRHGNSKPSGIYRERSGK